MHTLQPKSPEFPQSESLDPGSLIVTLVPRFRRISYLLLCTVCVAACAAEAPIAGATDESTVDGGYQVATKQAGGGYVDLEFVVNERGKVENPIVLYSTDPLFEEAAINAALNFEYKPRIVDGKPVSVSGVTRRVTFELEEESEGVGDER